MTSQLTDAEVGARLRHTLATIAETFIDEPTTFRAEEPAPVRSRWRRRVTLGAIALAVPLGFAAAAVVRTGPEYVDRIPADSIIVEGQVDGHRYLLVESRRLDRCGQPINGVEFVEEDENLLGSEWNTTGLEYGTRSGDSCHVEIADWLAHPARTSNGGTQVGDSFVWVWAVHPDVTAVRITAEGQVDLPIHRVDGAGYAVYEVPKDSGYTAELLIDGTVVPGSREEHSPGLP